MFPNMIDRVVHLWSCERDKQTGRRKVSGREEVKDMLSLYLLGLFLLQSTNVVYSLYERGYIDYQFEKLSIKSGEKVGICS